jgi:hypothetical protein
MHRLSTKAGKQLHIVAIKLVESKTAGICSCSYIIWKQVVLVLAILSAFMFTLFWGTNPSHDSGWSINYDGWDNIPKAHNPDESRSQVVRTKIDN